MPDPSGKLPRASKVAKIINENLLAFFTPAEAEIDYASLHCVMADRLGLKNVILEWTRRAWDELRKLQGLCFPHDGYLKMYLDGVDSEKEKADYLAFGQFDGIMFDEAQDADSVMAEIIFRQRPFSRIMVVGDPNQMIYKFRGTKNECFDDSLYPVTYNKSSTYSFRFGLGIATAQLQHIVYGL
ncbi:hypothetical protein DFP73DRAFT_610629 [Morchella snyderi]|nr:hypothetical protein DFP73DRAFT_610629 [Morchella snyderi]